MYYLIIQQNKYMIENVKENTLLNIYFLKENTS
jgi:hypothetical protein